MHNGWSHSNWLHGSNGLPHFLHDGSFALVCEVQQKWKQWKRKFSHQCGMIARLIFSQICACTIACGPGVCIVWNVCTCQVYIWLHGQMDYYLALNTHKTSELVHTHVVLQFRALFWAANSGSCEWKEEGSVGWVERAGKGVEFNTIHAIPRLTHEVF